MGLMKPFKAPTIVARTPSNTDPASHASNEPPHKKRRISSQSDHGDPGAIVAAAEMLKQPKRVHKLQPLVQKSTNAVALPSGTQSEAAKSSGPEGYYTVLWWVILFCATRRTWEY